MKNLRTIGWSSPNQLWNRDTISGGPDTSKYEVSNVFHESKARIPSSSTPKRWSLRRTTWPCHRGKLHMQRFDFSMDPVVRAIFETFLVTRCLEKIYNHRSRWREETTNDSFSYHCLPFLAIKLGYTVRHAELHE